MSEDRGGGLTELLKDFEEDTGIRTSAIVSRDGLVMASSLPRKSAGSDEDTVAANAARILFLGEATGKELAKGDLQEVLLNYQEGKVALAGAGPYAAVMALIDNSIRLETGAILYAIGALARKVKKLLEG
ncbi:MAG TPA: roadblock/LC7 domain-containing protein [Methanosarcinales archaeon]|nr:roadblock/LC7 domain-containing protein [Methanosarcinales archaeon]HUX99650.1 roadblock/LC7 domain-containing protein [Candidatus Deferrimicrobium sp.]